MQNCKMSSDVWHLSVGVLKPLTQTVYGEGHHFLILGCFTKA